MWGAWEEIIALVVPNAIFLAKAHYVAGLCNGVAA